MRTLHTPFLLLLCLTCDPTFADSDVEQALLIGFLVPMDGAWDIGTTMASALPMAVDNLQEDPSLAGYNVTWMWRNSECRPGAALAAMTELLQKGADILVGPGCSTSCEPTQLLASTINLAQVFFFIAIFLSENVFITLHGGYCVRPLAVGPSHPCVLGAATPVALLVQYNSIQSSLAGTVAGTVRE